MFSWLRGIMSLSSDVAAIRKTDESVLSQLQEIAATLKTIAATLDQVLKILSPPEVTGIEVVPGTPTTH
jgi:hypothetical protein